MPLTAKLDLENPTFGELYRFVDHARSAGIPDDQPITVETTDEVGNELDTHTLVAELGDLDELSRPILIDPASARVYADALSNVLMQKDDKADRDVLSRLANALYGLPNRE